MSSLREAVEDYLRMRRALGYKLKISGWHLEKFVSHLEQTGAATVTIENAAAWATSAGTDPSYWAQRLSVVRQFARHLQTVDPACEVPPAQLLPYRAPRAIPYLYEPEEIIALMRAAGDLEPPLLAAPPASGHGRASALSASRSIFAYIAVVATLACRRIGAICASGLPARNRSLASVCRSRCGPTRSIPARSHA
jgi:hypothetical protein